MDEQKGVTAQRRRTQAEIEQIVTEFEGSGLRRAEFCRRHGISLGTLNRYLKRIRGQSDGIHAQAGLVPVELAGSESATEFNCGALRLVLSRDRRIEVGAGFDALTLKRLINLLETM